MIWYVLMISNSRLMSFSPFVITCIFVPGRETAASATATDTASGTSTNSWKIFKDWNKVSLKSCAFVQDPRSACKNHIYINSKLSWSRKGRENKSIFRRLDTSHHVSLRLISSFTLITSVLFFVGQSSEANRLSTVSVWLLAFDIESGPTNKILKLTSSIFKLTWHLYIRLAFWQLAKKKVEPRPAQLFGSQNFQSPWWSHLCFKAVHESHQTLPQIEYQRKSERTRTFHVWLLILLIYV